MHTESSSSVSIYAQDTSGTAAQWQRASGELRWGEVHTDRYPIPNHPSQDYLTFPTDLYADCRTRSHVRFDRVFNPAATNADVSSELLSRTAVHGGVNGDGPKMLIMAYGHTGSGKTHSVFGGDSTPGDHGLTGPLLRMVFDECKRSRHELTISVLEVYKEKSLPPSTARGRPIVSREEHEDLKEAVASLRCELDEERARRLKLETMVKVQQSRERSDGEQADFCNDPGSTSRYALLADPAVLTTQPPLDLFLHDCFGETITSGGGIGPPPRTATHDPWATPLRPDRCRASSQFALAEEVEAPVRVHLLGPVERTDPPPPQRSPLLYQSAEASIADIENVHTAGADD
ncbi:hypothetical protein FOZ60_011242 [Perkinsus olseni]|uniref:Kinesin motor domain-containing protein n=1 Tax=Perkinsus olseni TaxID=32597 RepID=A0A7J6NEU8_PEROL|nr:hypothetical protein FOZ60_011242 [Perkinsus olseni]